MSIKALASSEQNEQATSNRCRIGDFVVFDCPNIPESHGRSARVIRPAGFNGPDWWELELLAEFAAIPDPEHAGGHLMVRQSFAPDSILAPSEVTKIERVSSANGMSAADLFYVIDSHGIIYGPAMSIGLAHLKAFRMLDRTEIVPAWLLGETVAVARELSQSTAREARRA